MDDYIFRYKLESSLKGNKHNRDAPTEMIKAQLGNLLNILIPCTGDKEVRVDGFKLLNDRKTIYKVFPVEKNKGTDPEFLKTEDNCKEAGHFKEAFFDKGIYYQKSVNAALYEPRIEFIKKQLESILSLVDLESNGKVVEVDGFRLKDLRDWLVASNGDPVEVFEYTGHRCNCNCVFCYNKGAPPSLALVSPLRSPEEEIKEIKSRIKYFLPDAKTSLFPSLGSTYEVSIHPYFLETLKQLRKKTARSFRIATNGGNLTPELIFELSRLKPLYLDISLNSASPSRRRDLMQDNKPEIAINALPLLKKENIPYSIVIVPWPLGSIDEMLTDMEKTVAYAVEHEASLIQISLPGYSKYFSKEKVFDLDFLWKTTIKKARELRAKFDYAIVVMPTMYEENIWEERKNQPKVIGVVKNSPAAFGGLRRDDLILQINGLPVRNRPQARDLLSVLQQSAAKKATIVVQRDGRELEVSLDLTRYAYPYILETIIHLGVVFMGTGLRMGYLEKLKEIIQTRGAKHVLFLSSTLVKPTLEQCLSESKLFGDLKINIEVPENRFLGGNIFMGDLLVVQDFIDCIKEYIEKKERKPDLVVIPSSPFNLSQWGRDLTGRIYLDIERETGIPVELLECATIYD